MFHDIATLRREGESLYRQLPRDNRPDREEFVQRYITAVINDEIERYKGVTPLERGKRNETEQT